MDHNNGIVFIGTAILILAACGEDRTTESNSVIESSSDFTRGVEVNGQVWSVPILQLEVFPGVRASFYVWEDLSAGYSLLYDEGTQLLADDELEGLSIAEVFWALSPPGTPIPTKLLEHHAAVVADGELSETDRPEWYRAVDGRDQGWIRDVPVPRALAACNNTNFYLAHCALGNGYTGWNCVLDQNGDRSVDVCDRFRFKAGFCIDAGGQLADTLAWTDYCAPGGQFIWLGTFPSPWYGSWEWIAPGGAAPRRWQHYGSSSVALRDWGSKWGNYYPSYGCGCY